MKDSKGSQPAAGVHNDFFGDFALTNDDKKAVLTGNLRNIEAAVYAQVIARRVAVKVDDKPRATQCDKELARLEMAKDIYLDELKGLS